MEPEVEEKKWSVEKVPIEVCMCEKCEEEFDRSDMVEKDGVWYCTDCFDETYFVCGCCSKTYKIDESKCDPDGDLICDDCFSDHYFYCESCEEVVSNDDGHTGSDDCCYCQECWADRFGYCASCDGTFCLDDLRYDENAGESYCGDCYEGTEIREETENIKRVIHDYSYRPELKMKKMKHEPEFYMGIELEVQRKEGSEDSINKKAVLFEEYLTKEKIVDAFYMKHDSSVEDGFEIVSQPFSLGFAHKNYNFRKILAWMRKNEFTSHESGHCGLHIHLSREFFEELDLVKLRFFFSKNKSQIYKFSHRDGQNDTYCQYEPLHIKNMIDGVFPEGRYWALNLNSSQPTIELRAFRGTLKYDRFIATLQFAHAISHFVKDVGAVSILKGERQYKNNSWLLFTDWCKTENRYNQMLAFMRKEKLCV